MSNTLVIGSQWGDEGKGKVIDYLTETADVVVRSQGGSNAGHTVIANGKKYVLHLVPSGILWKNKVNIIANGVVINPIALVDEINYLKNLGVDVNDQNLLISDKAHVVLPIHKTIDESEEKALGENKIGTTKQGIGPAYADKARRIGIRMCDLKNENTIVEKLKRRFSTINSDLCKFGYLIDNNSINAMIDSLVAAANVLRPHIVDTVPILHDYSKSEKNVLFEGAQGAMLDIDFGSYPYVTSSNTTAGGCCIGSGVPPTKITKAIGVCKAYTTRVGAGPFVSEDEVIANHLHSLGREYGATTGRERRCGWLDAPLLSYSVMVNGFDELIMTNLDGLDEFEEIKVCIAYSSEDGSITHNVPTSLDDWNKCKPVYRILPGWKQDTSKCKSFGELPEACKDFINCVSEVVGCPITAVGVGPDRDQFLKAENSNI